MKVEDVQDKIEELVVEYVVNHEGTKVPKYVLMSEKLFNRWNKSFTPKENVKTFAPSSAKGKKLAKLYTMSGVSVEILPVITDKEDMLELVG